MKNIIIICIVITCLLFSGCVGGKDEGTTDTSFSSEAYSESGDTPDLVIKPSDVPGLSFDYHSFYAFSISDSFEFPAEPIMYTDTLPQDTRKVGEAAVWDDETGHTMGYSIMMYDSDLGLEFNFYDRKRYYEEQGVEHRTCNIGKDCYYMYSLESDNQAAVSLVALSSNDNVVLSVAIIDEKDKSEDEAIRIAKIIEGRL
ncbi:MAG: hypothetical protein SCH66_03715 [Methanolobus sp.]|nr:hypothetical protein [Methanolobus sp.]